MNQQALEAAAKALCEFDVRGSWGLMGPIRREPWIERARAALTAYAEASGERVVWTNTTGKFSEIRHGYLADQIAPGEELVARKAGT